jgi:predicted small lipoprotein YifL
MSRGRQCLPRALLAAAIAGCGLRGSALLPPISPQARPP